MRAFVGSNKYLKTFVYGNYYAFKLKNATIETHEGRNTYDVMSGRDDP